MGGAISSYIGYFMGSQALKVVTQPDINSENKNSNQKPLGGKHKGLQIIEEEKILQEVYNEINKKSRWRSAIAIQNTDKCSNRVILDDVIDIESWLWGVICDSTS